MRNVLVVLILTILGSLLAAPVAAQPMELKITNLAIDPPPKGLTGPHIELHMNRSYRFQATIERGGPGKPENQPCFTVRTECVRPGSRFTLGEARVGVASGSGWNVYAVYDVFPSSAGDGPCELITTIDADNEISEPDEGPLSNQWGRDAMILP